MSIEGKIIDLTLKIFDGMPVFPGTPRVDIKKFVDISEGYELYMLKHTEHIGTHVDAPSHMIKGGKTIDELTLENFIGKAIVIDVRDHYPKKEISKQRILNELKKIDEKIDFLFYYTGSIKYYGKKEYFDSYPYLSIEAANLLVKQGLKGIGTDAPSPDYIPFEIHKILLKNNLIIYESLCNLEKIIGKPFNFIGLPLKLCGCSGSPVRAIALV